MKPAKKGDIKQDKITVLNYKNTHFNLVVGPDHLLSQCGSLTFQAANQSLRVDGESLTPAQDRELGTEDTNGDPGNVPSPSFQEQGQNQKLDIEQLQEVETGPYRRQPGKFPSLPQEQELGSEIHQKCEKMLAHEEEEIQKLKNRIKSLLNQSTISGDKYDY